VIVAITKFKHGAWIVIVAMPFIVGFFLAIHRHYERVGRSLRARRLSCLQEAHTTFVVLVPDLELAATEAIGYLRAIRPERVVPLYTGVPNQFEAAAAGWRRLAPRLGDLEMLSKGDRPDAKSIRRFLRELPRRPDEFITVVVPETITSHSLLRYLRPSSALWLKASLLFEADVVVMDIPLLPEERESAALRAARPVEPERHVVLVPVSAVHDPTVRAVIFAKSLHPSIIEGLFFVMDPGEIGPILDQWAEWEMDVPLAIVDTPFRNIAVPLLSEIRKYTSRSDTVVTIVIPEFVVGRWWQQFLHNQTGLFMKRTLLFEPNVVVISIPYHLEEGLSKELQAEQAGMAAQSTDRAQSPNALPPTDTRRQAQ
jgi:hypothetical protein